MYFATVIFVNSFIHSFIHSLIHSFTRSLTHSLTHALIHSFIHYIHICESLFSAAALFIVSIVCIHMLKYIDVDMLYIMYELLWDRDVGA
jgi:hypothetical protein